MRAGITWCYRPRRGELYLCISVRAPSSLHNRSNVELTFDLGDVRLR